MINAYILAGGKSSRMGEEKGLITYKNKPLIEYAIDAVKPITKNIFILSSNQAYKKFGFEVCEDEIKDKGPAGAIDTLLQHTNTNQNIVLACDMPFVDTNSISFLLSQSADHEVTIPIYNHYPEALFGIYSLACKEKWHNLLLSGVLKMSDLLSHFATKFVDGNAMCENNPLLFKNMNTKEDLNFLEDYKTN